MPAIFKSIWCLLFKHQWRLKFGRHARRSGWKIYWRSFVCKRCHKPAFRFKTRHPHKRNDL